jgi:hypothetical protein
MDTKDIFQANRESTVKMQKIGEKLTEADFRKKLHYGWTIPVAFAHLAFWDNRVIPLIELSKKDGTIMTSNYDDKLNDILLPFLEAIPPAKAIKMAVEIANRLDEMLESCSPEMINQIMTVNSRWVDRSLHRNDHLKDIESALL